MAKKVLFIVEGNTTENNIVKSISSKIFKLADVDYEIAIYNTVIYEIYDAIVDDPYLSTVSYLVEKGIIKLDEKEIPKQAFSQIYLIFDFDPQYQKYADEKILKCLEFFSDESENGKLYINYPMVEANFYLDDFDYPKHIFDKIKIEELTSHKFKKLTKEISCFKYGNNIDFSLQNTTHIWVIIKWNYIRYCKIMGIKNFDSSIEFNHLELLKKQLEEKNNKSEIYIIGTISLLIIDYNPGILDFLEKNIGISNSFLLK